jgi:hypothetical protein
MEESKLWKVSVSWVQRDDADPSNGELEALLEKALYSYETVEVTAEELAAKRVYTCSHCGQKGHSRRACPKLLNTTKEGGQND